MADDPPPRREDKTSPPREVATSSPKGPVSPQESVPETAIIEVDEASNDETFDEQASSYTASLTSSIYNYSIEHGRRYHAFRAGSYVFPNDERELERLDKTHIMFTKAVGDKLYTAPLIRDNVQKILDIGTGTGTWAIEVADLFQHAEVIGNDLSPVQTPWYVKVLTCTERVPPNVQFEVDDVESEWVYDFKFDFIFCRQMTASIADWPKLFQSIYDNLAPGGWAEFQDLNLTYTSDDGSLTEAHYTHKWATAVTGVLSQIGRDPKPGLRLRQLAEETGFQGIEERIIKLPIGPWPKDPKLKEVGMINQIQLLDALEAVSLKPLSIVGYSDDEVLLLTSRVRQELKSRAFHGYYSFHVVYGQKPTDNED